MNRETVDNILEHAYQEREHRLGLTTTIFALLAAIVTLAGHRAHTEEVIKSAQAVDKWAFYEAKHLRAHLYLIEAEKARADRQGDLAARFLEVSIYEQCGRPAAEECKNSPLFKNSSIADLLTKLDDTKKPAHEESAVTINKDALRLDGEVKLRQRIALWYDWGEVCFEFSIMLCGIALMAKMDASWKLSFLFTAVGSACVIGGWLLAQGWLH